MIFEEPDRHWTNSVGLAHRERGSGREVKPAGNLLLAAPVSAYSIDALNVEI